MLHKLEQQLLRWLLGLFPSIPRLDYMEHSQPTQKQVKHLFCAKAQSQAATLSFHCTTTMVFC